MSTAPRHQGSRHVILQGFEPWTLSRRVPQGSSHANTNCMNQLFYARGQLNYPSCDQLERSIHHYAWHESWVTRCVFFEKIAQNIALPVFCQNYYITFTVLITSHKIWASSLIYK
jgi:hypothetical protein